MNENPLPTRAYDLLDNIEKSIVDDYVSYAVNVQRQKRERIINALHTPFPSEYIRRSRNALYKPLIRAAIAERIKEESDKEDISPDRVIKEHITIATSNPYDFMEEGPFGEMKMKRKEDIDPSKLSAIKGIETKPGPFGLQTKVILHDKLPSLKALGEMMGLTASDTIVALQDYIAPPKEVKTIEHAPERAYSDLLETIAAS